MELGHAALTIFQVPSLSRMDMRSVDVEKNSPTSDAPSFSLVMYYSVRQVFDVVDSASSRPRR